MKLFPKSILLGALLILACAGLGFGQIQGTFDTIGPVPEKHSQKEVVLDEYLNFTCPHCNNFRNLSKPLFEKYGDRIKRRNIPILFKGQNDYALRLYFIAEKEGRGGELKEMIFDATFTYGFNISDPKVISFLARSSGMWEQFQQEVNAEWVNDKIRDAHLSANRAGVRGTPTIVLNNSIRLVPRTGMQIFVDNLDQVIAQLLK